MSYRVLRRGRCHTRRSFPGPLYTRYPSWMLFATRRACVLVPDPRSVNVANTRAMTDRTCSSGSRAIPPSGDRTYPMGTQENHSPRRAVFIRPWYIRAVRTWSSASDIIPRNPSNKRSAGSAGSYTPSASAISTWNRAH